MNKFFATLCILGVLTACGMKRETTYRDGKDGKNGKNGLVGAPGSDGSSGSDGSDGLDGSDGSNGHSSLVDLVLPGDGGGASCLNGGATIVMGLDLDDNGLLALLEIQKSRDVCNGLNGSNGADGSDGQNGQDGQNGEDGQDGVDGTNGTDGSDGLNAPVNPYAPVALVNPCGDAPGIFDEVFIRLSNGSLIASFSQNANGLNTRLSVLVPGSYQTTDGDACSFTVDANNQVTNENHTY